MNIAETQGDGLISAYDSRDTSTQPYCGARLQIQMCIIWVIVFFWHLFRRILVLVTSATWTPGKLVFENDHEHDVRGIIIWTYLNNHLQPHFLKNVRQQLDYPFSISLASWHFSSTVIMQPVLASTVASYHLLTYTLWYLDIAMDNIG